MNLPRKTRESFLIKQIVVLAWDPTFGFFTHSAAGNQAVQMEMGPEPLIPGVQNSHKAGFSTQLVLSKLEQGFGYGFKQDVEHDRFVFQDEGV